MWDFITNASEMISGLIEALWSIVQFFINPKEFIKGIYSVSFKWFGYTISFSDISQTVKDVCNFSNLQNKTELWNIVTTVNNVTVSIGLSLLTLFFMINMIQKALEIERVSWEKVMMEVIRFFLYKFLVQNSLTMLSTFLNIANNYMLQISNSLGTVNQTLTLADAMANGVDNFGATLISILLWIVIVASTIGAIVPIVSVMVKIVISLSVAPIPISLGISDYGRNTAKSFIMSVIGLGIETWLIIILTRIYLLGLNGSEGIGTGVSGVVSNGFRIIFANSLFVACLNWATQKVQSMVGGN